LNQSIPVLVVCCRFFRSYDAKDRGRLSASANPIIFWRVSANQSVAGNAIRLADNYKGE
jgi:hypothetical protein